MTMRTFDYSPFFRSSVGFDRLFDLVSREEASYPPYNIEKTGENNYRITLAVAGFAESELNAELREGVLTVSGKHEEETAKEGVLYRGIAGRGFERRFQLADHVEVRAARLENGLLHIELERVVPEEQKPRRIAINGSETVEHKKAA
jgi:molecular chaperone IbpA